MARRQRQVGYYVPTGVPTDAVGGARHVVSVMVQLMERCTFQRVYHWLVHRWSSRVGCTTQGTLGGKKRRNSWEFLGVCTIEWTLGGYV